MGISGNITAQLVRLSRLDGSISFVPGAVVDSNSWGATGQTNLVATGIRDNFDLFTFYYYVRIDLNRPAGSTTVVTFYGVALEP